MIKALLLLLLFGTTASHAQIMGKSVDAYTTKMGTIIHVGDTIRFGLGTDIGGQFKYAGTPPNAFLGMREQIPYRANMANQRLRVKDIRVQSMNKRMAPRTLAVVNFGGFNSQVDLEAAEESGEIKTAANSKLTAPPTQSVPAAGVADELLKLKKLLDAGAITQQEFDTQKAKLLAR